MKKSVLYFTFIACLIGLSGCSTSPKPLPIVPQTMADEFQQISADIIESGGLAAVGTAQSKSLALALKKAKTDGRIKLADLLELKIETLQRDATKETVQSIIANHIQGIAAKKLEYETTNGLITAYALMDLDPQVLDQEIKTLSDQ